MAITINIDAADTITLEEYVMYMKENIDLRDLDSVVSSAPMFKRLLNNRTLITEHLNKALKSANKYQAYNNYSAHVILLEFNKQFIIRANVWEPVRKYDRDWLNDNEAYSYDVVHDHNFSFMTGGYLGRGYETVIWEWDGLDAVPEVGERVDIRFLENTSLPEGKIMVYRASQDIHRQERASEFSISLNLLIHTEPGATRRQYLFDPSDGRVVSVLAGERQGWLTLCDMAPFVANGQTIDLLEQISKGHADPGFRSAALLALHQSKALEPDELIRRVSKDSDVEVLRSLKQRLGVTSVQELQDRLPSLA